MYREKWLNAVYKMNYFSNPNVLNSTISSAVSLDLETSWAAKSLKDALEKARYDARFQQKQMQEKEEKLLKLYESQQQRAFERVGRGSAGNSISGGTSPVGAGKVRQMFDERRQKAGIDRSYPLEPLKQTKANGYVNPTRVPNNSISNLTRTTVSKTSNFKQTVQRTITQSKAGKAPVTYGTRQNAEATFINGEFKYGNIEQEVLDSRIDDNGNDPIEALRNQEKELEIMMKNHRITDDDYDDDTVDGHRYGAIENSNINGNYKEKFRKPTESISASNTPVKNHPTKPIPGTLRDKNIEKVKKPVSKTQSSPGKPISTSQISITEVKSGSRPQSRTSNISSPPATPDKQMKSTVQKPAFRSTTRPSTLRPPAPSARSVPPSSRGIVSPKAQASTVTRDDLKPCAYCNRRFAADRIALHQEICARTVKKKRKTYDPVKHRVQGTEAESYLRKNRAGGKSARPQHIAKADWRRQHEEFISAIRAAKQTQAHLARGGKLSDLPPPPPSYNPDYIQCPHCGRRFNEAAAARHIPKCATMLHNKPNRLGPNPPPKKKF